MQPIVDVEKLNIKLLGSDVPTVRVVGELMQTWRLMSVAIYPWSDVGLMQRRLQAEQNEAKREREKRPKR